MNIDIDKDIPPPPTRPPPGPPPSPTAQSSSAPPIPPHRPSVTPPSVPLRKESLFGQYCHAHEPVSKFEERFITHFNPPSSFPHPLPPACPSSQPSPLNPSST